MAVIVSGVSSTTLTVDPTSKALRIVPYSSVGTDNYVGPKATYQAATTNNVTVANGAAMFFVITGSSTKTIIVQKIVISGHQLTVVGQVYASYVCELWSTAPTGGTATALTQVPLDSNSAAATANLCQVYTAAPTEGNLIGTVDTKRFLVPSSSTVATQRPDTTEFDFRTKGSENSGIYLIGTAHTLSVAFAAAPGATITVGVEVQWTEQ